ncbi:CoA-disulfide reductase [Berryella intestinalis]|uniref:CoA-disulfide reductase n=1 Tax=Berryella intestinalis TaxID=1531429 RepID=A0A0A8B3Y4_9ACTN|nr:FAD-dependent oxidoreductase [Berryella intestinalis]AJC12070.1 CoA-disulfide reductase [Berryella intestinalis]
MRVVIIGGVAGGATAAARLRRLDEFAEIVILERSGYVSYANCGLPYYIGGVIADRAKLTLQTPESFRNRFDIDVRVRHEALSIDRAAKTVLVEKLDDGTTYKLPYDKLILSPGARPAVPAIPGVESSRLFTLRTVEDTFAISDFIEREKPKRAVIVGGGFIGLEMAENLVERGIRVSLLQRDDHVMPVLDADMAAPVQVRIREEKIDLRLGADVTGFSEDEAGIRVAMRDKKPIEADFAVLAIGVRPESELAKQAGLELNARGFIRTDAHMRTSDEDIYAVGDAVEVVHAVTGLPAAIPLAGPANKQGRIAADNICGIPSTYDGSQGSSILKLFDLTVAATGLNVRDAEAAGLDFDYALLLSPSHATYYPDAKPMTLKVVFEKPSGRILGAQIVGYDAVDKRIDVLATAIRAGMTAADLETLDLCYAPPYSSAKDPVNMAGYVIGNLLDGRVRQARWSEALGCGDKGILLDIRTPTEFAQGSLEEALHIPLDELRGRLGEIPAEKRLYVYCQSGLRSYVACRILSQRGFDCANVAGGYGYFEQVSLEAPFEPESVGPCGLRV